MQLDRFYPIFPDADWIEELVPLGIKLVQLRVKDMAEAEIRDQIERSQAICSDYGCTLVINDYWQLAIEMNCDWVHLGQEDLDDANLDQIRAAGLRLGVSTHDEVELDRALGMFPDYIALGPVWPTKLKKMRWEQQGLERVTEWKQIIGQVPLVAIGGLTVPRAAQAFGAGADICSVVTDITLDDDPQQKVLDWINATRIEAPEGEDGEELDEITGYEGEADGPDAADDWLSGKR